jgi:16S rRNA (guanine527-N7)-methyltransferase
MSEEPDYTPELEPAVAADIFGAGIDKARAYASALIKDGDELGLLGPRELPKLWLDRALGLRYAFGGLHPAQLHDDPAKRPN